MQQEIDASVRKDIGRREHGSPASARVLQHLFSPPFTAGVDWRYRFQGKVISWWCNARTGDVQGERPYSKWRSRARSGHSGGCDRTDNVSRNKTRSDSKRHAPRPEFSVYKREFSGSVLRLALPHVEELAGARASACAFHACRTCVSGSSRCAASSRCHHANRGISPVAPCMLFIMVCACPY